MPKLWGRMRWVAPPAASLAAAMLAVVISGGLAACGGPTESPSAPSPSASSFHSASASASPSRSASASLSPSPSHSSAAPIPSPSPPCPSDNALRSWYYAPNDEHRTPGIPDDARRLLDSYGGHYVGDTGEKVVYLTFDEGYENGRTDDILDALQAAGVPAASFVTGSYVRGNPELVRRMADEGHVVANHTDAHPPLPSLAFSRAVFRRELTVVEDAFREATGADMTRLLRPPMGEYSARSLCLAQCPGYETVFWSFAHRDWLVDEQPPVAVTLERMLAGRHDGAIYLLHAVSSSNTEALPRFIEEMRRRGYRFGALTEVLP